MLPNLSKTRAHITGIKINTRTIGHTKLRTTPLCHTGIKNNTHATFMRHAPKSCDTTHHGY